MKNATSRTTKTGKVVPASGTAKPTDWRKRFAAKKEPKVVVSETDFPGVKAGNKLYIATPGIIANYIAGIPHGETRTIERLRNELARNNKAHATCPVSTAIFLRIVAEAAWDDLTDGVLPQNVVPFWRVIDANAPIAKRLRCDSAWLTHMRAAEAVA
jgi:hypothetical protein